MRFCSLNTCRWIRVQGSVFHPYIDRGIVFIACLLRFVPLPSTVPGLRQHILWLSQRRWLLRPSHTGLACGGHLLPGSVGGLGGGRARQALLRSWKLFGVVFRVALFAGVLRDALWITGLRVQPFPRPFWAKPIIHIGLLFITTIPCDRLSRPLHNVDGQSQSWGVCIILASRREELHLYSLQVITDLAVSTPHPWLCSHFEGTDRRAPWNVGSTPCHQKSTNAASAGSCLRTFCMAS